MVRSRASWRRLLARDTWVGTSSRFRSLCGHTTPHHSGGGMSQSRATASVAATGMLNRPPPGGGAATSPLLAMVAGASAAIASYADDEGVGEAAVTQVAEALQASGERLVLCEADRQWLRVRYA